jgi:hypothetical protein
LGISFFDPEDADGGREYGKLVDPPADFIARTEVAIPADKPLRASEMGGGESVESRLPVVRCPPSFGERR